MNDSEIQVGDLYIHSLEEAQRCLILVLSPGYLDGFVYPDRPKRKCLASYNFFYIGTIFESTLKDGWNFMGRAEDE